MKTYKSINSVNLFTSIELNGKSTSLAFTGGHTDNSGKVTNGTFSTDDEKLQKAIEADSSYGKSFVVVGGIAKLAKTPNAPLTGTGTMENINSDNDGFEKVLDITNAQMAAEWLTTNKKVDLGKTPKAAEVKAKALELKVNFVDWK